MTGKEYHVIVINWKIQWFLNAQIVRHPSIFQIEMLFSSSPGEGTNPGGLMTFFKQGLEKTLFRFSGLETIYERLPMGNEIGCSGDSGR